MKLTVAQTAKRTGVLAAVVYGWCMPACFHISG